MASEESGLSCCWLNWSRNFNSYDWFKPGSLSNLIGKVTLVISVMETWHPSISFFLVRSLGRSRLRLVEREKKHARLISMSVSSKPALHFRDQVWLMILHWLLPERKKKLSLPVDLLSEMKDLWIKYLNFIVKVRAISRLRGRAQPAKRRKGDSSKSLEAYVPTKKKDLSKKVGLVP